MSGKHQLSKQRILNIRALFLRKSNFQSNHHHQKHILYFSLNRGDDMCNWKFKRVWNVQRQMSERAIFQTFWRVHICTKSLFFEIETSNFGSSYVFSRPLKWQGRILPNLTFWLPKRHISGKIQHVWRQNLMSLTQETLFWHNGTWILPEICRFWIQIVMLGKIWPRHFYRLKKIWL